jgi:hypothetical protein
VCLPLYLRLLVAIAKAHSSLQRQARRPPPRRPPPRRPRRARSPETRSRGAQACAIVATCLKIDPDDPDSSALTVVALRRQMVDGLLLLLARGCALPVLAVLREHFDSPNAVPPPASHARAVIAQHLTARTRCAQDMSLVRHSVLQLFALVAPPFSEAFASQLLRIARHARVREAFRDDKSKAALAAGVDELAAGGGEEGAAPSKPAAELVAEMVALARPSGRAQHAAPSLRLRIGA